MILRRLAKKNYLGEDFRLALSKHYGEKGQSVARNHSVKCRGKKSYCKQMLLLERCIIILYFV